MIQSTASTNAATFSSLAHKVLQATFSGFTNMNNYCNNNHMFEASLKSTKIWENK